MNHMRIFTSPAVRYLLRCSVLFLLVLGQAGWAMSIRELRALERLQPKQGADFAVYYLVGTMEATVYLDEALVRAGAAPRLCLNGRRLEPAMALSIYKSELRRNADLYEADMPVPLVMFNALATVYPC
jgi:hypothetical protein